MVPIRIHKEQPGYVLNSLLVPFLNAAAHLFVKGIASPEDIDKTWKIATGAPSGPFEIYDVVGMMTPYHLGKDSDDPVMREFAETLKRDYIDKGYLGEGRGPRLLRVQVGGAGGPEPRPGLVPSPAPPPPPPRAPPPPPNGAGSVCATISGFCPACRAKTDPAPWRWGGEVCPQRLPAAGAPADLGKTCSRAGRRRTLEAWSSSETVNANPLRACLQRARPAPPGCAPTGFPALARRSGSPAASTRTLRARRSRRSPWASLAESLPPARLVSAPSRAPGTRSIPVPPGVATRLSGQGC